METRVNNNGFDYIDLGLPSGTLWATCNVGASSPSESGLYFQWGDTKGYTKEQVGKEKQFNFDDYKWNPNGDRKTFTKYTFLWEVLELKDDAANVNMGGDWHMPTYEQVKELINSDNTTSYWIRLNDASGMKFISKKDASKSIFIPAAGQAWDGLVRGIGYCGIIWTSMLCKYHLNSGQYLLFTSKGSFLSFSDRYNGFSIRGVIG